MLHSRAHMEVVRGKEKAHQGGLGKWLWVGYRRLGGVDLVDAAIELS